MVGDTLIFLETQNKKVEQIIPLILKKYKSINKRKIKKLVVTISGKSGTNKTEIAHLIQKSLWESNKIRVKKLHLDNYYLTPFQTRNEIREKQGIKSVGIKEINWYKLKQIIKTFRSNRRKLYVQQIHKYLDSVEYIISPNKKIEILLIEGIFATNLRRHNLSDLAIHLEGNDKQTYEFRKLRMKENPDDIFRQHVLKKESKDCERIKKYADILIEF